MKALHTAITDVMNMIFVVTNVDVQFRLAETTPFTEKTMKQRTMQSKRGTGGQKMANEKQRLMKAWLVREKHEMCSAVVFAETRGKARALALATDACEDAEFCNIDVCRMPLLDKYYVDGKKEMDWNNHIDRIALVKDGGFYCDPIYWEPEDCENCPAREYCDRSQDLIKEREEESWI